jgi:hypothetical protein
MTFAATSRFPSPASKSFEKNLFQVSLKEKAASWGFGARTDRLLGFCPDLEGNPSRTHILRAYLQ